MTRKIILSAIVIVWVGVGGIATAATQPGSASELIRELGERVVGTPRASGTGLVPRSVRLRSLFSEAFDLPFMSRFVIGPHWERATPEQRTDYLALFGAYVFKNYSARIGGYTGKNMKILSERSVGPHDVLVNTRIKRRNRPPVEAGWVVRTNGERDRIIDVRVGGTSMLISQRSEFATVLQRQGLEGLIQVMRARTGKPSATASTN